MTHEHGEKKVQRKRLPNSLKATGVVTTLSLCLVDCTNHL